MTFQIHLANCNQSIQEMHGIEKGIEASFTSFKSACSKYRDMQPDFDALIQLAEAFDILIEKSDFTSLKEEPLKIALRKIEESGTALLQLFKAFPSDHRSIEKQVAYLLLLAEVERFQEKDPFELMPYYGQVLRLRKGSLTTEERRKYIQFYECYLKKSQDHHFKTLISQGSFHPRPDKFFTKRLNSIEKLQAIGLSQKAIKQLYQQTQASLVKEEGKFSQLRDVVALKIYQLNEALPSFEHSSPFETTWQALQTYRDNFKEAFDAFYNSKIYTQSIDLEAVKSFQKQRFEEFKTFFKTHLVKGPLSIFLPYPFPLDSDKIGGRYDIRAVGSIGRLEITPYSDLELFILSTKSHSAHCKKLAHFIQHTSLLLCEGSPPERPGILSTDMDRKGLYIDPLISSLPPEEGYIPVRPPEEMAAFQKEWSTEMIDNLPIWSLLKSSSLKQNDQKLFPLYREALNRQGFKKERALLSLKFRIKSYQKLPQGALNLKSHYIQPLCYLIYDLGIYQGIDATNSLDILNELASKGEITSKTALILQRIVAYLYLLRIKIQCHYDSSEEDFSRESHLTLYTLDTQEETFIAQITSYLLPPLYARLQAGMGQAGAHLLKNFDLIEEDFSIEKITKKEEISAFVTFCIYGNSSLQEHTKHYTTLSKTLDKEELRKGYIDTLKQHDLTEIADHLAYLPNPSGERQIRQLNQRTFEKRLLSITTTQQPKPLAIQISSPLFEETTYLTQEVIDAMIDPNSQEIKSSSFTIGALHFRPSPKLPTLHYALCSLMTRIAPNSIPPNHLVTLTTPNANYETLISQAISGESLEKTLEQAEGYPPALDEEQLTALLLASLLILPFNSAPFHYKIQEEKIICIPTEEFPSPPDAKQFLSLLFLLNLPLSQKALQTFLQLDPSSLVTEWFKELFPKKASCFQQGSIRQFTLQQRTLREHLTTKACYTPLELLDALIITDPKIIGTYPIGPSIKQLYQKAITQPLPNRTAPQIKSFPKMNAPHAPSLRHSLEEFLELKIENLPGKKAIKITSKDQNALEVDFSQGENPRLEELHKQLKMGTTYHRVALTHCRALTYENLLPFLHSQLLSLDIRGSLLKESIFPLLEEKCPNLEELYLSHSAKIKKIDKGALPLKFQKLRKLDISHSPQLQSIHIDAPALTNIHANYNPQLKPLKICHGLPSFHLKNSSQAEIELIGPGILGKKVWEKIGQIKPPPPLPPNIGEILSSPSIFSENGEKVSKTHLLVLIPESVNDKPLTPNSLKELLSTHTEKGNTVYHHCAKEIKDQLGAISSRSHWILMTKNPLPHSAGKSYEAQQALLKEYTKKSTLPYQMPTLLEAAIAILLYQIETHETLYSDAPISYTCCSERLRNQSSIAIGNFTWRGIHILKKGNNSQYAISGVRRL